MESTRSNGIISSTRERRALGTILAVAAGATVLSTTIAGSTVPKICFAIVLGTALVVKRFELFEHQKLQSLLRRGTQVLAFAHFGALVLTGAATLPLVQQIKHDHQRAERDRSTVCRTLDIDRTQLPPELPPELPPLTPVQRDRLSTVIDHAVEHVAPSAMAMDNRVTTPPILVQQAGPGIGLPAIRMYRRDAEDVEGVVLPQAFIVAERACTPEEHPCVAF